MENKQANNLKLKKSLDMLEKGIKSDYDFYNIIKRNLFEQKVAKQRLLNRIEDVV